MVTLRRGWVSGFIFIAGGSRSGKSSFAIELAKKRGKKTLFIATCVPKDGEMKRRVALHRKARPSGWKTEVTETGVKEALLAAQGRFGVVIIDCLGLYLSNLLSKGLGDNK